ncbi:hypothetical protein NUU61_002836 [Penicillium alfredii]|uniref:Uncharacterized protein n=1 Tax=Penicillium alfredii TaxID=1506179 RepID=A0A9W9FS99_9EURO|nr:uncharacterized protein NUU61_002836 [Penicillium alfredii]KAJ5105489.1 hypothetical protein NUU61_002836 [Penicillium alfredii]
MSYTAERASIDPVSSHTQLCFRDDDHVNKRPQAAINVKSIGAESRLVVWFNHNFSHPVTQELEQLESGFQLLGRSSGHRNNNRNRNNNIPDDLSSRLTRLDFLRTKGLLQLETGRVLPHDIPGPRNDVLDEMEPT